VRAPSGAAAAGRDGRTRTTPAGPRAGQSRSDRRFGGRDPPRFRVKNMSAAVDVRTRRRRRPGRARFVVSVFVVRRPRKDLTVRRRRFLGKPIVTQVGQVPAARLYSVIIATRLYSIIIVIDSKYLSLIWCAVTYPSTRFSEFPSVFV